jgi:hypothetical protein
MLKRFCGGFRRRSVQLISAPKCRYQNTLPVASVFRKRVASACMAAPPPAGCSEMRHVSVLDSGTQRDGPILINVRSGLSSEMQFVSQRRDLGESTGRRSQTGKLEKFR